MAIEYAKSALAESIIPVKDVKLVSTGSGSSEVFIKVKSGDVVQIVPQSNATEANRGKINSVTIVGGTDYGVVNINANLGVLEGTNFEGVEQQRKIGKIRTSGNAIYRGEYGTVNTTTGAFSAGTITENLIGAEKAINKGANGFNIDSEHTTAGNLTTKIVGVDVKRGYVYFQFKSSAIVSS